MSARGLEIANQFLNALETAAQTGDLESVSPFLTAAVEWVTRRSARDDAVVGYEMRITG